MNVMERVRTPGPNPNPSASFTAAVVSAISGGIIWALNQYVFTGKDPGIIEVQVSVLVPAALGYLIARITRSYSNQPPQVKP